MGPEDPRAVIGEFTIRPAATDDDAAGMAELERQSAIHHAAMNPERWHVPDLEDVAAHRRFWLETKPRDGALLAVAGEQVVGMVELWLRRPRAIRGSARLSRVEVDLGIAVDEAWRGHGVGTPLLQAAEEWARAHGAERMSLDVDAENAGALRLYERMGYETWSHTMDKAIEPLVEAVDAPSVVRNADGDVVPTLIGDLVTLRPLRDADRTPVIELLRDPSITEIWDTRGPEHSADELIGGEANLTVWAIEVDGEFAGSIQAHEETDADYRSAGIDIFMSTRFQGRGLGTDVMRTMVRYLIDVRGHRRLTIDPAVSNARAIRTYEKVGFKPVGVMRQYERGRDGTFHDGLLMDLIADDPR